MRKGFTLIETLIYIAIVGIVIGGFVAFTFTISDSRNKNYVVQEVQANARVSLNLISQRIMAANGINTGASIFDADPGVLSLSMADSSKNPTILNLSGDDGQLQIKEGAGDIVIITADEVKITNLVFTNLTGTSDIPNVGVELTVEFNNLGTDVDFNYDQSWQTSVSLRQ